MLQRIILSVLFLTVVSHATLADDFQLLPLNDFCGKGSSVTPTPWGDILLSVPNEPDGERIALLARIHEKKIYLWGVAPIAPASGRGVPTGMVFGEDENLYLCDNQNLASGGKNGRVLRILVNAAQRPYAAQLVASEVIMPHRVSVFDEHLYVTQYFHPVQEASDVWQSALYRFPIHVENIPVTPLPDDPSLIHTFQFTNPEKKQIPISLCFDASGKLFVGNPAEGVIYHLTLDDKGKVQGVTEYLRSDHLTSIDGMAADAAGNLYVGNAASDTLFRVTPEKTIEPLLVGKERGFRQPRDLCLGEGILYFTCQNLEGVESVGVWTVPSLRSVEETPQTP